MDAPSRRSARIITSLNLKGGVGKTHLCWLVAGVCQERGQRCLIVDLDKQGNISATLLPEYDGGEGSDGFFNPAIDANISTLIQSTSLSHVDLIPGSFRLERFNLTDPTAWSETDAQRALVDPLRQIAGLYDYILLDCPPDISLITYAALCASNFLLVPLEAAQWGALGTQHVLTAYDHVRSKYNADLKLLGFVVSRYKRRRKYQDVYLRRLREHFGEDAFETLIPDLAPFEQSVNDRLPITLHSPSSHASSIAREFVDELEARAERLDGFGTAGGRLGLRPAVHAVA